MVFAAHRPHGLKIVENVVKKGSDISIFEKKPKWEAIKESWLRSYRERLLENGKSAVQKVNERIEWC